MGEKVAIVGTRDYPRLDLVVDYVYSLPMDTVVVSGGGGNVDLTAERAARERGMPEPIIFQALWKVYGKSAGPIRNKLISVECNRMVAFWDGVSPGTRSAVDFTKQLDKIVEIIDENGMPVT